MLAAGYHPSCLEVHDRWVGVQSNHLEDEDDNVSRKVNINMEIGRVKGGKVRSEERERERESGYGSDQVELPSRKVSSLARSHSQPSHIVRNKLYQRDNNNNHNNSDNNSQGQYLVMTSGITSQLVIRCCL